MCTSGDPRDLAETDGIAAGVLEEIGARATDRIRQQYDDNIRWIREAGKHKMVGFETHRPPPTPHHPSPIVAAKIKEEAPLV